MQKFFSYPSALAVIIILAGWSAEQSTGKESRKQKMNFSGKLVTHTGQSKEYHIDNISLNNLIDKIPFYELPALPLGQLLKDPRLGTVFEINLEKGLIIEVREPVKIWSFKRNDKATKIDYIAIVVTPCHKGEQQEFIVEAERHLLCDELGSCEPISMKLPLSQIKKLSIEDGKTREESRQCPIKQQNIELKKTTTRAQ